MAENEKVPGQTPAGNPAWCTKEAGMLAVVVLGEIHGTPHRFVGFPRGWAHISDFEEKNIHTDD